MDLLFLTRFKEGRLRVDREDDELPQVARRSRTVKRVIYELFFHAKRPVPARISVTGQFYDTVVLPEVARHYKNTHPRSGTRGIHLLHDNEPVHTSVVVIEYHGIKTLPYPPCNPHIALCNLWLNPVINERLRGRRFENRSTVGIYVFQCMNNIPQNNYKAAFFKWIVRLKKCVDNNGKYFEGFS